jgi:hypothetical protein
MLNYLGIEAFRVRAKAGHAEVRSMPVPLMSCSLATISMRCLLILTVLTFSEVAQAQPIFLACNGDMVDHAHGTSEKRAIIAAVNLEARTITVLGYDPVLIVSEATDGTVGFSATRGRVTGVTGLASIDFKTNDGVQSFDGVCKRAEKLF